MDAPERILMTAQSTTRPFGRRLAFALALAVVANSAAGAQTILHVGKAQANQFAFIPTDIGLETGLFKKHGLDVEISAFGGDARMM
jgi:ABC-type nitrate/sulfonate/bicarbonate transport system substrate-binding protein